MPRSDPKGAVRGVPRSKGMPKPPAGTVAATVPSAAEPPRLTRRQSDVLQLLLRGLGNREIATHYGISERTIRAHLTALFRKFSVTSRTGLIATVLAAAQGGVTVRRTVSARTKARAMSARFKAYDKAPFAIAVTSGPEHRYVFCNELAAQVAVRKRERIVGRTVSQVFPDHARTYGPMLDSVFRTGIPWTAEKLPVRYAREDGTYRDVTLNLLFQPRRDTDGVIEGILHLMVEVT